MDGEKQRANEILEETSEKAFTELKQCRKDYIDKLLVKKEELKGSLQNILNETIQRIKEMKVGGVLNAAGMPTEEHKRSLDLQIENEISTFETTMSTYVTTNYTPFKTAEDTNLMNCLDDAETAFTLSYDD